MTSIPQMTSLQTCVYISCVIRQFCYNFSNSIGKDGMQQSSSNTLHAVAINHTPIY